MEVFYDGKWGEARHKYPCAPLNIPPQRFHWYGAEWFMPAMYGCAQGVVFDLFSAVPLAEYRAFLDKWMNMDPEEAEQQSETVEAENPLDKSVQYRLLVNGRELRDYSASGSAYIPNLGENPAFCEEVNEVPALLDAYDLLEQYPDCAWHHMRVQMPWATKRRPKEIRSLVLQLAPQDKLIPVPVTFEFPGTGNEKKEFSFTLPGGSAHRLCVLESTEEELPEKVHAKDTAYRWPRGFSALRYTIEPPMPENVRLQIRDTAQGDSPVYIGPDIDDVPVQGGSIGVIFRLNRDETVLGTASSVYFNVPENLRWCVRLYGKPEKNVEIRLLP